MNIGPVWWDYFSNINESFLIQDGTGLCLVNIKVHIFRTLVCRLSSPVDVVKNDRVPFCLKISYFCSIFWIDYFSRRNNFKYFTVVKIGNKIVIFIRLNIRFQCASYRRFPRSSWRKTRKRWFPWIFAQNKIICFSYRCGQYRGSELWKFGLFTVLFEKKNT